MNKTAMAQTMNFQFPAGRAPQLPRRQRGAILIFCLVFLAALTMMGSSGMQSTTMEERMSANMRDYQIAFQAAESGIKAAEAWLINQVNLPITSTDGTTAVWVENAMDPAPADGQVWWKDPNRNADWWGNNATALSSVAEVAAQPGYIIEQYRTVDSGQSIGIGSGETTVPRIFHRITSRGVGLNATTEVIVQTTFVRTYD